MAAGDVDRVDDETRVRMPGGAWKWLRTKGRVVARGADGKPTQFAGTVADVTEFKEFGERLRRSEAHFRELIRSLPIPLAFANDRGEIVDLNEAFTRMLGYDLGDIPTVAAWYERAYPDPAYRRSVTGPWDETVRKVATEGGPAPFTEARVTCKNGDVRTVLITGVPLGESLLVTLVDVTERRTAEKALARSEARYRGLFDTLMDGLCVVDMGGAIQEFNETYRQMLGWSADELRKMTYTQLTPEKWHVAEARIVAEQLLGGLREGVPAQGRLRLPGGAPDVPPPGRRKAVGDVGHRAGRHRAQEGGEGPPGEREPLSAPGRGGACRDLPCRRERRGDVRERGGAGDHRTLRRRGDPAGLVGDHPPGRSGMGVPGLDGGRGRWHGLHG